MIKTTKSKLKDILARQSDAFYNAYPRYEHEAWTFYPLNLYVIKQLKIGTMVLNVIDIGHTKGKWVYTPPSYPKKPKVKRGTLTAWDISYLNPCPKHHNKLHHIRPFRRANKRYCQLASQFVNEDMQNYEWLLGYRDGEMDFKQHYKSEYLPEPSYKKHIYYL